MRRGLILRLIMNVRNTVCSSTVPRMAMGNVKVVPHVGTFFYPTTRMTLYWPFRVMAGSGVALVTVSVPHE